jgi:hypothetical protein
MFGSHPTCHQSNIAILPTFVPSARQDVLPGKRDDMIPEVLAEILKEATKNAVEKTLIESSLTSAELSPAAAYRIYGRSNVERWLQEGLIRYQSAGSGKSPRKFLDNQSLEAIAASSNRVTYLPVAER